MAPKKNFLSAFTAAAVVAVAAALSGCGASHTVGSVIDPVARAADVTAKAPGYRLQATMSTQTAQGTMHASMSGVMDQTHRVGEMTERIGVAGHDMTMSAKYAGTTAYISAAGFPGASQLTHGKPWLKLDLGRAFGAIGLSSLTTTSSNPAQYLDYLRAVGAQTKRVGTQSVRGVSTTHYHAVVDLSRYPRLLPPAKRAAATRGVAVLEAAIGSHTMPMDVWVDSAGRVRQMTMTMSECVSNQHVSMRMSMDMFDYAPQPQPQLPAASQVYDLTPLVSAEMKKVKLGCGASS